MKTAWAVPRSCARKLGIDNGLKRGRSSSSLARGALSIASISSTALTQDWRAGGRCVRAVSGLADAAFRWAIFPSHFECRGTRMRTIA
ncbi:hypothetical protein R1flu_005478 [Riccia fluitans]|uniref:Uncharacterized protein n=1 Tax=Riccia fluitans TaxID=41844 RepID=A0ABD1YW17_9MARC